MTIETPIEEKEFDTDNHEVPEFVVAPAEPEEDMLSYAEVERIVAEVRQQAADHNQVANVRQFAIQAAMGLHPGGANSPQNVMLEAELFVRYILG